MSAPSTLTGATPSRRTSSPPGYPRAGLPSTSQPSELDPFSSQAQDYTQHYFPSHRPPQSSLHMSRDPQEYGSAAAPSKLSLIVPGPPFDHSPSQPQPPHVQPRDYAYHSHNTLPTLQQPISPSNPANPFGSYYGRPAHDMDASESLHRRKRSKDDQGPGHNLGYDQDQSFAQHARSRSISMTGGNMLSFTPSNSLPPILTTGPALQSTQSPNYSQSPQTPPLTPSPRRYHGRQSRTTSGNKPGSRELPLTGPSPNRRLAHIISEQKRREKINGGFDELKSVVPECAHNPDSKATILRKAVDYILLLEDEIRRYSELYPAPPGSLYDQQHKRSPQHSHQHQHHPLSFHSLQHSQDQYSSGKNRQDQEGNDRLGRSGLKESFESE